MYPYVDSNHNLFLRRELFFQLNYKGIYRRDLSYPIGRWRHLWQRYNLFVTYQIIKVTIWLIHTKPCLWAGLVTGSFGVTLYCSQGLLLTLIRLCVYVLMWWIQNTAERVCFYYQRGLGWTRTVFNILTGLNLVGSHTRSDRHCYHFRGSNNAETFVLPIA